jgi:CheY-like chemotaxis protein
VEALAGRDEKRPRSTTTAPRSAYALSRAEPRKPRALDLRTIPHGVPLHCATWLQIAPSPARPEERKERARDTIFAGTEAAIASRMNERDEDSAVSVAHLWQPSVPARIIVAENDRALRDLVMAKLLDDGHEVYGASCASELLHLLADGGATIPPVDGADLIVVDQHLPGLSGIEIIRRLRIARSKIPFLMMTALPTSELLRETKHFRVPVLVKPFSLSDLSNAALLLMIMTTARPDEPRATAAL